jgi:hypothetical protein
MATCTSSVIDRKTEASMARYSDGTIEPVPSTPRPEPDTPVTIAPPSDPIARPDPTVALRPPIRPSRSTARSNGWLLLARLVAFDAGLVAAMGAWPLYRRSHPTFSRDERAVIGVDRVG